MAYAIFNEHFICILYYCTTIYQSSPKQMKLNYLLYIHNWLLLILISTNYSHCQVVYYCYFNPYRTLMQFVGIYITLELLLYKSFACEFVTQKYGRNMVFFLFLFPTFRDQGCQVPCIIFAHCRYTVYHKIEM